MKYTQLVEKLTDEKLQNDVASRFCHCYDEWSSKEFAKEVIEAFVDDVLCEIDKE